MSVTENVSTQRQQPLPIVFAGHPWRDRTPTLHHLGLKTGVHRGNPHTLRGQERRLCERWHRPLAGGIGGVGFGYAWLYRDIKWVGVSVYVPFGYVAEQTHQYARLRARCREASVRGRVTPEGGLVFFDDPYPEDDPGGDVRVNVMWPAAWLVKQFPKVAAFRAHALTAVNGGG